MATEITVRRSAIRHRGNGRKMVQSGRRYRRRGRADSELETDKVTVSERPAAGTLSGSPLRKAITSGSAPFWGRSAKAARPREEQPAEPHKRKNGTGRGGRAWPRIDDDEQAVAAVRKLVEENNLDPSQVTGTGKDGRLTKGDVLLFMKDDGATAAPPAQPAPAHPAATSESRAEDPREERVKMTRLRQRIAERLKEAQNTAAMLTTFNEIDMTNVIAARRKFQDDFEKRQAAASVSCRSSSRRALSR